MRSFYIFIITMILVLANSAQAQLMQPYKAKEGESKARTTFEKDFGSSDLLMVGTISGEYEGVPVKLEFDLSTGEASAWLYMFHSEEQDTSATYAVVKTAFGMQAMPINAGDIGGGLPFNPTESLDEIQWMNSDKLMENIRENSRYTDFLDVFPNTIWAMGALFVEPMQKQAVWAVIFKGDDTHNLNCFVDAVSGETQCMSPTTDVEDVNTSPDLKVYPNPVSDMAIVSIPIDEIDLNANLKIYDMRGNQILAVSNFDINSDGSFALNVSNLAAGVYSLIYSGNGKYLTANFVVVR